MTSMTRGLTTPRRAVLATTNRIGRALSPSVEAGDGRKVVTAGHDERAALRREYAWVEAAANAAFRGRV